jgi:hypothetical protein
LELFRIEDTGTHDLVIRATDVGVCSNRLILSVLHERRQPRHEVFEKRNVWSLFNAFTESLKDGNLAELPRLPGKLSMAGSKFGAVGPPAALGPHR